MAAARHLLVGFDGSPNSRVALRRAAVVARHDHARLTVILVLNVLRPAFAGAFTGARVPVERMELTASEELRRAVKELPPDVSVTSRVVQGSPGPVLAREAQRLSADAVIIGSRSGICSRLSGGVARYLRLHARIPVAVVAPSLGERPKRRTAGVPSGPAPPAIAS